MGESDANGMQLETEQSVVPSHLWNSPTAGGADAYRRDVKSRLFESLMSCAVRYDRRFVSWPELVIAEGDGNVLVTATVWTRPTVESENSHEIISIVGDPLCVCGHGSRSHWRKRGSCLEHTDNRVWECACHVFRPPTVAAD